MRNLKKKIFLIAGGTATLVVCLLVGAFFAGPLLASAQSTQNTSNTTQTASTPTATNYCQQYLQDLAQRLNVSASTFEQDRTAAKEDILAQLVKDGKLTQAQANTIKQRMQSQQACKGKGNELGLQRGIMLKALQQYRTSVLNQVAQGLHLTSTQLQSDLQQGQSLSKIAKAQNVSATQLHTIVLNAVDSALNQAQQAGVITQSQDTAYTQYLKNHPAVVNADLQKWDH